MNIQDPKIQQNPYKPKPHSGPVINPFPDAKPEAPKFQPEEVKNLLPDSENLVKYITHAWNTKPDMNDKQS